jgi:N-acetylglucosamine-6-phosphate deacetylase
MSDFILSNARVICPHGILLRGSVWIQDGKIKWISDQPMSISGIPGMDLNGLYLSPGFIDIHLHGGGGFDFMDAEETAVLEIARLHALYGTTSILPTTLTSTTEHLYHTLEVCESLIGKNIPGARLLGVHIEGPYFAYHQRGAQNPKYIRPPDPTEYLKLLDRFSCIRRWSVAPELDGALELGRELTARGILASIAHTEALYHHVQAARIAGYRLMTHLYSAMLGVTRINAFRYGGAVEAAFLDPDLDVEIIADGKHLPPELLQLIYSIKGSDHISLITDAMRAAGTTVTSSRLGTASDGLDVIIEDGVAKLPDRQSFAGSIATANNLVKTMRDLAGIPLIEAIKMITATPARIMGIEKYTGRIAMGLDADLCCFDENLQVQHTWVKGVKA